MSTVQLSGNAPDVRLFSMGFGLMRITLPPNVLDDDSAFALLTTAIGLVPTDQKLFLNSGEFYGRNPKEANLLMLNRFFTKYPELADRTYLSVKGAFVEATREPDCSPEGLRSSVDNCIKCLGPNKKIDLFEPARVDPRFPVEEQMQTLVELMKEGKFSHIGLSECKASTLRRAHAIHPVTAVEIEVSPLAYEEETKAIIATTAELGVALVAYSPVAWGALSTGFTKDQWPADDFRNHFSRFQDEAMAHNQKIVTALQDLAQKKNISVTQASLAWVRSLGPHVVPIPGTTKIDRVKENLAAATIDLTPEETKSIIDVIETNGLAGERYMGSTGPGAKFHTLLWG